ncbi:GNAT family N-acetyltransferase [Liquorilactobacillus satsumensis]|uniref:GNAT family N-acetyltransferase n=1 Tax=Liquorilactobacillus satsumensis TaxID=259059 RepID=UPI0039E90A7F
MIRNVKEIDGIAIQRLNKDQLGYDYPLNKTNKNLKRLLNDSRHHYMLVFEDDNTKKVNGYVHAELYEETYFDPMFNILALAVYATSQNKGIGKQLMIKVEKIAKNCGVSSIRLNSGESRLGAHEFYKKLGYVNNKSQKRFEKTLD